MVSYTLTLGLAALSISGLLMTRSVILSLPFTIFGLLVSSSIGTLAGVTLSPDFRVPAFFLSIAVISALAARFSFAGWTWPSFRMWLGVLLFNVSAVLAQVVTRELGLGSVAFGDGQTILMVSQAFQDSGESLLVGAQGLKRGFALPALQSFGPPGEYAAGFLPLIFTVALLVTLKLYYELSTNKAVFIAVATALMAIVLSTEAILRHLYLMNSHAIAWLLSAYFLVVLVRYLRKETGQDDLITIALALATISFLRLDLIILFSPFIVSILIISSSEARKFGFVSLALVAIPAWLWMTVAVQDFPYFGPFGPTILLALGFGGGVILLIWLGKRKSKPEVLKGRLLWVFSALPLLLIILLTDTLGSLTTLFVNLFLGEGLWGFTPLFLFLALFANLLTKDPKLHSDFGKAALRLFVASLSIYLWAKFLDGNQMWALGSGWARVGFGDSLNRTLLTWLPFYFLPVLMLFSKILPTNEDSTKTSNK